MQRLKMSEAPSCSWVANTRKKAHQVCVVCVSGIPDCRHPLQRFSKDSRQAQVLKHAEFLARLGLDVPCIGGVTGHRCHKGSEAGSFFDSHRQTACRSEMSESPCVETARARSLFCTGRTFTGALAADTFMLGSFRSLLGNLAPEFLSIDPIGFAQAGLDIVGCPLAVRPGHLMPFLLPCDRDATVTCRLCLLLVPPPPAPLCDGGADGLRV